MTTLNFWDKWHKPYKIIYQILLLLFFMTIAFALSSRIWGNEWVLSWELIKTYKPIEAPIATLDLIFSIVPVQVEHYALTETFQGSDMHIFPELYTFLAILSLLLLSVLVSIITTLSRFWYFLGMIVIAFVLVALRLEQLMLFKMTENAALSLAMLLYFPLSYYFQFIKKHVKLYKRIICFFIISLLYIVILGFFSNVNIPFAYIGAYGMAFPLVLSFIFIVIVSHDILSGFLFIITSGNTINSKNSLQHFIVISGVYLGWVLLTYLHNTNNISWDMLYLDEVLLLSISAIVGIWGFRNRSEQIFSLMSFAPAGAFLYLILGIISFATLGSFYLLANYPMLEMLEDAIIFTHLGVGLMFFIYVLSNFGGLLKKNFNVFKVQYKPMNLPYFTATLGGIVLVGILVSKSQLLPYFQGIAGYYNGLGDLYVADQQLFLGEQYYKLAKSYDARNQKSNYALATMARKQGDEALALKYFDAALLKKPSKYAYVNIANIYESKGRFFDALFTLKKGLDIFPESPRIKNNLGVLFSQTSVIDSALFYLGAATLDEQVKANAEVNILSFLADARLSTDFDSLRKNFETLPSLSLKNNTLVNLNIQQLPIIGIKPTELKVARQSMEAGAFTFWYEYALNQIFNTDAAQLAPVLDSLSSDSLNARFQTELVFAFAAYNYYHNRVGDAFLGLKGLANNGSRAGYYNYLLGLWALEQDAYRLATVYFGKAQQEGYNGSSFPMAVALSTIDHKAALPYWENVQQEGNSVQQSTAALMQTLFLSEGEFSNPSDSLIFLDIKFLHRDDIPSLLKKAGSLSNSVLQGKAWLIILNKALKEGYYIGMEGLLEVLEEKPLDKNQKAHLTSLQLRYWLRTNQFSKIQGLLQDTLNNRSLREKPELVLYLAKSAFSRGDKEEAKKRFLLLATLNPFFEEGIVAAADFFQNEMKDEKSAYGFLLNALEINPYSISLQKAYILQCLNMQLISYAEHGLATLKELSSPKDYKNFLLLYKAQKDSLEQAQAQWQ